MEYLKTTFKEIHSYYHTLPAGVHIYTHTSQPDQLVTAGFRSVCSSGRCLNWAITRVWTSSIQASWVEIVPHTVVYTGYAAHGYSMPTHWAVYIKIGPFPTHVTTNCVKATSEPRITDWTYSFPTTIRNWYVCCHLTVLHYDSWASYYRCFIEIYICSPLALILWSVSSVICCMLWESYLKCVLNQMSVE